MQAQGSALYPNPIWTPELARSRNPEHLNLENEPAPEKRLKNSASGSFGQCRSQFVTFSSLTNSVIETRWKTRNLKKNAISILQNKNLELLTISKLRTTSMTKGIFGTLVSGETKMAAESFLRPTDGWRPTDGYYEAKLCQKST